MGDDIDGPLCLSCPLPPLEAPHSAGHMQTLCKYLRVVMWKGPQWPGPGSWAAWWRPSKASQANWAPGPRQTQVQGAEATVSSHVLGGSGDHLGWKLAKGMYLREEMTFRVATMWPWPDPPPKHLPTHKPFACKPPTVPFPSSSPILLHQLPLSLLTASTFSQQPPSSEEAPPWKTAPRVPREGHLPTGKGIHSAP